MKGLRISNTVGKVLIVVSILMMLGALSKIPDSMSMNYVEQRSVVTLPSGVQYTIRDPFREKEEFMQTAQLMGRFTAGIVLAVSGIVVCVSTKKQIKAFKNVT